MHVFESGSLCLLVDRRAREALASGALQPLATSLTIVNERGIPFLVRVVNSLRHKQDAATREPTVDEDQPTDAARSTLSVPVPLPVPLSGGRQTVPVRPQRPNPFLPYDQRLHVADIDSEHVCLLNKFNVQDGHILIVTRAFESQDLPLTRANCSALATCLAEMDGLAFYNSGSQSGASQPHRHLQIVPLPLLPSGPRMPIAGPFETDSASAPFGHIAAFDFQHAFVRFDLGQVPDSARAAEILYASYRQLRKRMARDEFSGDYNLLVTRRAMLYVPRRIERFETLSLNALAFCGAILVRDQDQLQRVREVGPLALLKHVTFPADPQSDRSGQV